VHFIYLNEWEIAPPCLVLCTAVTVACRRGRLAWPVETLCGNGLIFRHSQHTRGTSGGRFPCCVFFSLISMNHILLFTCHRVSGEAAGSKHIKDVALFQLLMQPPFSLLFLFVSRFMYLFHGVHWLTTEGSVPRNDNNVV